jgi:GNAT superfamily N-acetyltransferase
VILPVDVPLVRPEHLRALAAAGGDVAISQTGPLPGVYARRVLPSLERRLDDKQYALRESLRDLDVRVVELDAFLLANVNTPQELEVAARRDRAVRAAVETALAHGVKSHAPRILQDWNDTIVHLAPAPLVARVRTTWLEADDTKTFRREVAVAAHATARGAPVVAPSREPPPGPHRADSLVFTFWEYAEELPGEVSPRQAGLALKALHEALTDYPGPLPPLTTRLDRAQAVADDPAALPALSEAEQRFLADTLRDLRSRLDGFALDERPLHGGPHPANLLRTVSGPRWIDLDTVCRGPLEWDLAHLPEAAAVEFPEVSPDALAETRKLVSAEVAVWCWRTYGRAPEVDEAARFHLDRLRTAIAEPAIVPFASEHTVGFRSLVSDTLREFGFEPDPEIDPDLTDPAGTYAALWIAVAAGEVIGSIALRDLGDGELELKRMYLRPDLRGRGLGRRLLATALDWARANGSRAIKLDTSERMVAARSLYEAHGFQRVAGDAPRQGQKRLLYVLELERK